MQLVLLDTFSSAIKEVLSTASLESKLEVICTAYPMLSSTSSSWQLCGICR